MEEKNIFNERAFSEAGIELMKSLKKESKLRKAADVAAITASLTTATVGTVVLIEHFKRKHHDDDNFEYYESI